MLSCNLLEVCLKQRHSQWLKILQPITLQNSTFFLVISSLCNFNLALLLSRCGKMTSTGRVKANSSRNSVHGGLIISALCYYIKALFFAALCEWWVDSVKQSHFHFNTLGQHLLGTVSKLHSHSLMLHIQRCARCQKEGVSCQRELLFFFKLASR